VRESLIQEDEDTRIIGGTSEPFFPELLASYGVTDAAALEAINRIASDTTRGILIGLKPWLHDPCDAPARRAPCAQGSRVSDAYRAFLAAKAPAATSAGFEVELDEIHPYLMPHARAIVQWAVRGGRRAIFASFGLHKTVIGIETVRLTLARAGGRGLIVLPLGVRQEFFRDAAKLGVTLQFIQSIDEATDPKAIYVTNYETVRLGKLEPADFTVVHLDEADVLRTFGSKTFSEFLFGGWALVPYRYVATATPDPNDYLELLGYAQFLDIMDIGHSKTRFFKRDSQHADHLTLHAHKALEFWLWVATWGLIVTTPSDLGFSDEGFVLPEMEVRWHEVPSDHTTARPETHGQGRLFKNAAYAIPEAAREKRDSLAGRIAKLMELRAEDLGAHRIIWHDLEDERRAIEAAIPAAVSVYGHQKYSIREAAVIAFADGESDELASKPTLTGAGCNLQRHCAWAIFLGIGYKFRDFIQAVHRIYRFGQTRKVRIDLIYTEAERPIRAELEAKWKRHTAQQHHVAALIREYGLAHLSMAQALTRSTGVERVEVAGDSYRLINNDCVLETQTMSLAAPNSVHLIVTSIPFSTQYEYTPSFNDFGHTDGAEHFWRQMDFLTPELLAVLKPGRVLAVHVKDRVQPGSMSGLGFQTIDPFHCDAVTHYRRHGFFYAGMIVVITDVVTENAQTYRLSHTEQCKDGSRMGAGLPEFLLLFRKAPTDSSNGYADEPVRNDKPMVTDEGQTTPWRKGRPIIPGSGYSRARWQLDAHALWRSNANRLLDPEELIRLPRKVTLRRWRDHERAHPYDYEHHVAVGEVLEREGQLPPDFMLLPPSSGHPEVWTDVNRFHGLNTAQSLKGRELHLCPLPFDIVNRLIVRFSMRGEVVYDPFGGLMTVPVCAVKLGRFGLGCELNARYFRDGAGYTEEAAAARAALPDLFTLTQEASP
jgi:DNA modification methylase